MRRVDVLAAVAGRVLAWVHGVTPGPRFCACVQDPLSGV